jgi:hypothetical protein
MPKGVYLRHVGMKSCQRTGLSAHLFLGTLRDNVNDMVAKGRHAVGERGGNAKLTESEVREIRALALGGSSLGSLGRRFGVGATTIGYIVRRETWAHLT